MQLVQMFLACEDSTDRYESRVSGSGYHDGERPSRASRGVDHPVERKEEQGDDQPAGCDFEPKR
jgi:hypothetical protein